MAINKTYNDYALAVGSDLYRDIPKAVFAAIAVSALTCGGDQIDEAAARVLAEWEILHANGIVPQKPPRSATLAERS
jgi:hypothetical protein